MATLLALTRTPPVTEETRAAIGLAGPAAVPALIRELDTGAPGSAQLAATALGQLGDRRAIAALVRTIDGGRTSHRRPSPPSLDSASQRAPRVGAGGRITAGANPARRPRRAPGAGGRPRCRGARSGHRRCDPAVRLEPPVSAGALRRRPPRRRCCRCCPMPIPACEARPPQPSLVSPVPRRERRPGFSRPSLRVATKRGDEEWQIIGDILAGMAEADDAGALGAALAQATGGERLALIQGLAAAGAVRPVDDPALVRRLVSMLDEGAPVALAAADALSAARVPSAERPALAKAFAAAEPSVAARLCPTIARLSDGDEWLAAVIADDAAPEEIRAAAIWAARDLGPARSAIAAAALGSDRPAANARAARTKRSADARAASTRIVVRTPEGAPAVGRWVAFESSAGGFELWARTDVTGAVRVDGLPTRPLTLRLDGGLLRSSER